jgi:hypothetical protein
LSLAERASSVGVSASGLRVLSDLRARGIAIVREPERVRTQAVMITAYVPS